MLIRQTVLLRPLLPLAVCAFLAAVPGFGQCISLTNLGTTYSENFNSLASSGTSSTVPAGWAFLETGTNANTTYTAGTGSSNTGDTYSFGAAASAERALGGLQSGSLVPTIGACFTNNTGATIGRLSISYTGEQWRIGTINRSDRIDFQFSANATSLSSGTWTDVDALDFTAPAGAVGAVNPPNTAFLSHTVALLTIPNASTFWIRWRSFDASGADDGLAVDDLSLTPLDAGGLSIGDVSVSEGDAGVKIASFAASLASPAGPGGVTFAVMTTDVSATAGSDYVALNLTGVTIPEGQSSKAIDVTINGDAVFEPNETFLVTLSNISGTPVIRGQAIGTILNDDLVPISAIQGLGNTSPFVGQSVITSGVVTAHKSNGFFLQTPDTEVDANPGTSEGIFVFTSSPPPSSAAVGNLLRVTGTVAEFRPSSDLHGLTLTEMTSPLVEVLATGHALPNPITLTTGHTNPTGSLDQIEPFEGMRVKVESLTVVAPTEGFKDENDAVSTSNGVFFGVITGWGRPFREPGIEVPDPVPPGPCCVPRFDGNPERLRVDSDAQPGVPPLDVSTGAVVKNLVGPLDYTPRAYTILPDTSLMIEPGVAATAVPLAPADQFTVATFNIERFFDAVNDPAVGDVALTPAAYELRLAKVSLSVRNILRLPDIVGFQEVENLSVLQDIAARINTDAAGNNPNYVAYLIEGNDPGGIDVGFLIKSARVNFVDLAQEGGAATFIDPSDGSIDLLNDRPLLVLQVTVNGPSGSAPFPITVLLNHLRSLNDIADPAGGPRVRAKRQAQAEFLANFIQNRQTANPAEHIVSIGDYNAFQFNDGYVDVMGTIRGAPASPNNVVLASSDLVNPNLLDAADSLPATSRYSFIFDGSAQQLDHVLLSANLAPRLAGVHYGRVNADFPEVLRGDATRPERLSDHDPTVAYFSFPRADVSIAKVLETPAVVGQPLVYTLTVRNGAQDAASTVAMTDTLPAGTTFQSLSMPIGWSCSTPQPGAVGMVSCSIGSLAAAARAVFTLTLALDCTLPNGAALSNAAHVTSATFDPDPANNIASSNWMVSNPPPAFSSALVNAPELWPPNGRMVDVTVTYAVADTCGGVNCTLSVSSNEAVNGIGDGNRSPDWEVVSPTVVRLRADRTGNASGRVYTITITCRDAADQQATRTVEVTVPHSKGNK